MRKYTFGKIERKESIRIAKQNSLKNNISGFGGSQGSMLLKNHPTSQMRMQQSDNELPQQILSKQDSLGRTPEMLYRSSFKNKLPSEGRYADDEHLREFQSISSH